MNKKVNLFLIKHDPFKEDFPGWPEVKGVYQKYLPPNGYNIWWIALSSEVSEPTIKKWEGINLYLVPLTTSSYLSRLVSALKFAYYSFKFLEKQLKGHNNDSIVQIRDSVIGGIVALLLKKKYKVPIVFNYSYLFYEEAKDMFKERNVDIAKLIYRLIFYRLLLYPLLRYFNLFLPISREMKIKFARELGLSEEKQVPLPLGVDPEVFKPLTPKEKRRIRRELGFDAGDVIFLYTGSINKSRRVSRFVKALIPVLKRYKTTKLLMIGRGDEIEDIIALAKDHGVSNKIIFKGWVSKEEVPVYYSISDVGFSAPKPAPQNLVMSPCKLFEYLASGLVVIATAEIPEQKRVVLGSKGGFLVKWDSMEGEIPELAKKLILSPKLRRKLRFYGYKHVVKNRSFERHADRVDEAYKKLLQEEM